MRNKFPKGHTIVLEVVSPIGKPIQPNGVCSLFASAIGAVVQDILDCSIQHWDLVPTTDKKKIWDKLKEAFSFPTDSEDTVKSFALKQATKIF